MSASKHQLAASAYHLKPADVQKLLLQANNFRDRCVIKTLWWLGVRSYTQKLWMRAKAAYPG